MIALTALAFIVLGLMIVACACANHGAEERERQRRADLLRKGGTIE